MPFYQSLDASKEEDFRAIENILKLRNSLKEQIPNRTHSSTLLLATWNIRDFDKSAYGYRLNEAYYYIAEIIASFDIVAVQEVYKDLTALNKLMNVLGGHWKYIFSDVTEGRRGNSERIAYLYDSRKVKFSGLAGELVLPPIQKKITVDGETTTVYQPVNQIWRTPLICGFQSGWAKFMLSSVHVQWGSNEANSADRIEEIEHIAKFLKKRTEDPTAWARKLILLGDFNIFSTEDQTYKVLEENEFRCPEQILGAITNMGKAGRTYDQILLRERTHRFEVTNGGTFKFFDYVFRDEDEDIYKPLMVKPKKNQFNDDEFYASYKRWRTHQMSDHLPLWVELKIDYTDEYLQNKLDDVS